VAAQLGSTSSTKIRGIEPWSSGYPMPVQGADCKLKASASRSASGGFGRRGTRVHANHGRASGRKDATTLDAQ
jgi:hypothetical protein